MPQPMDNLAPDAFHPLINLTSFAEVLKARAPYLLEKNKSVLRGLAQQRDFDLDAVEAALDDAHEHLDAAIAVYGDEIAAAMALTEAEPG
jgi:hypothetical protein